MHLGADRSEAEMPVVRLSPTLDPIKHGGGKLNPAVPPGHHVRKEQVPSRGVPTVHTHRECRLPA
jgi:hypothetical protein